MQWSCCKERYWRCQPASLVFTPTPCDSQPQPESVRRVVVELEIEEKEGKREQDKRRHNEHQAAFSVAPGSRVYICMCLQACPPKGINFLTALLSLLLSAELLNNIVAV